MKKFIIDRIEEGYAVCECEDLSHISIPVSSVSFDVREGMIICLQADGTYVRDENEEDEMRNKIIALQNKIRNKSADED